MEFGKVANTLVKTGLRLPIKMGKLMLGSSVQIIESAASRLPSSDQEHISKRLVAQAPLETAKQGAHDIGKGIKMGDEELLRLGEAAITCALVRAADDSEVPDSVTQEIAVLADEQLADPTSTPLVSDEMAERAQEVKEEFLPEQ